MNSENKKFMNDAVIGNKNLIASYSKEGELLRLFYPNADYKQFIDFFHTGVKINDSNIIYLHDDINNIYEQYYTENTNILNTNIYNTYFNLKMLQTDFVSIDKNILVKRYSFVNENTIDLDVHFLIHSGLVSNSNNMVSCVVMDNVMIQYTHENTFCIFSKQDIESHRINDSKNQIYTGKIQDKDYIGMAADSSISYAIGTIHPGEKKSIDIFIKVDHNKEKASLSELELELSRLRKLDTEKEYVSTRKFWQKYVNDHNTILVQPLENSIDKKIEEIYKRTILLFPLLTNHEFGGISAGIEVDENRTHSGRYSYCWPRDAVFIAKAFDILGMKKETDKFYSHFCKTTQHRNGIWEQRYYTDGRLAPCWGYQIDETASVIYGVYEHYLYTKDKQFLKDCLKMCENAMKFLKRYVDNLFTPDPAMPKSYDLWEMHEGIHTYSLASIFASFDHMIKIYAEVKELYAGNRLKEQFILEETETLRKYMVSVKNYLLEHCYDEEQKCFVRGTEDKSVDISVLGMVTPFGVCSPKEKKVLNTIEKINLTLRTYTGGYLRFEKDSYMGGHNPWVIATLWMALYYIQKEEWKKARESFQFVIETMAEHGFLGEQVDNSTKTASWVIGLGWSHAMFIIVLEALAKHGKN